MRRLISDNTSYAFVSLSERPKRGNCMNIAESGDVTQRSVHPSVAPIIEWLHGWDED